MSVQPENDQRLAVVRAMARDCADRAHRERVVSAEEDRPLAALQNRERPVVHGLNMGGDGAEVAAAADVLIRHRDRNRLGRGDVAMIRDAVTEVLQHLDDPAVRRAAGPITAPRTPAPFSSGIPRRPIGVSPCGEEGDGLSKSDIDGSEEAPPQVATTPVLRPRDPRAQASRFPLRASLEAGQTAVALLPSALSCILWMGRSSVVMINWRP